MNKSICFYFFVLCALVALPSVAFAYNLPSEAYGKPKLFDSNSPTSFEWADKAKNYNFGSKTKNPWRVYATSEGIKSYENPSYDSRVLVNDIHFMEDFYVANIDGGYAQLFYSQNRLDGLAIPSEVANTLSRSKGMQRTNGYIGWVKIEDLLLWDISPRTKDGVFQKIAIVKNVAKVSTLEMPELFKSASCDTASRTGKTLDALSFYFVLKKTDNGNVLVSKDYQLPEREKVRNVGWVKYGEYTDWNTRICWEPAFGNNVCTQSYAYDTKNDAIRYNTAKSYPIIKLTRERKQPDFPRFPVVDFDADYAVAELSVLGNTKTNGSNEDLDSVLVKRQKLDMLKNKLSKINVVFVMDATNSMKSCFSAMSGAVKEIIKYQYNEKVRFGVVAYRNYADQQQIVSVSPLTNDLEKASNFLSSVKCFSNSREPQEAMFYGINYAIDKMDWGKDDSNFIILVSDVTSKDPDKNGLTSKKMIDKLASKYINLVAFQARSQQHSAYQNFGSQVNDIIRGTLRKMGYSDKSRFDSRTQIFMYNQSEKWPLQPMGYKFKYSDERTIDANELKTMATDIIKNFIAETEKNVDDLETRMNRLNSQTSEENPDLTDKVCEGLVRRGKIKDCSEIPTGFFLVEGYARMDQDGKEMFTPCVFMADKELNDLIKDLEKATRGIVKNRRATLQDVFKKLILSYSGNQTLKSTTNLNFEDIVNSIENECQHNFFDDVKKHVRNANLLSDEQIETLVRRLGEDIKVLKAIQNDSKSFKVQDDGKKYYYVLLKDMPLVKKWN